MASSSVEANKAAIRRLYVESNKYNLDFLDELFAADHESPTVPGIPAGPERVPPSARG